MKSRGYYKQKQRQAAKRAAAAKPAQPCPCCGCLTIRDPGRYGICPVCFWEDDPGQTLEEDLGGANPLSLAEARRNYAMMGACEPAMLRHVRPPDPDELPPEA